MHDQLKDYFDKILSKYQCEFRKGLSTQHYLLSMIEKLQKSLDNGWLGGRASASLFTDVSKAFDCLPRNSLIAKLHAYGIKNRVLNLLFSYLQNRKQRVHRNNTDSEWIDIFFFFYYIFLCDLFLSLHNVPVANYADDNTPYCTGLKI